MPPFVEYSLYLILKHPNAPFITRYSTFFAISFAGVFFTGKVVGGELGGGELGAFFSTN